jgi:hypothetical protein
MYSIFFLLKPKNIFVALNFLAEIMTSGLLFVVIIFGEMSVVISHL